MHAQRKIIFMRCVIREITGNSNLFDEATCCSNRDQIQLQGIIDNNEGKVAPRYGGNYFQDLIKYTRAW